MVCKFCLVLGSVCRGRHEMPIFIVFCKGFDRAFRACWP